jgi:hypothetical protein
LFYRFKNFRYYQDPENIVGDTLIFFTKKTGKKRIQLNESALSFIGKERLLRGVLLINI